MLLVNWCENGTGTQVMQGDIIDSNINHLRYPATNRRKKPHKTYKIKLCMCTLWVPPWQWTVANSGKLYSPSVSITPHLYLVQRFNHQVFWQCHNEIPSTPHFCWSQESPEQGSSTDFPAREATRCSNGSRVFRCWSFGEDWGVCLAANKTLLEAEDIAEQ